MMIKALIITHLWSLIIAAIAWGLQRDKNGAVGINFPAPKIWMGLIALSFLPGALSFISFDTAIVLEMKIIEAISDPIAATTTGDVPPISYLMVYCVFSLVLMSQTLWQWARLQCLSLRPTSDHDIFLTDANVPPLTLSWPRRAVVLPSDGQNHQALIKHERTHLRHKDAEVTLFLLLIKDMMLRGVGIGYLVR